MGDCNRKQGICCAGELCKHAELQLVPGEHHCSGCGGVYHVPCAKFIKQPLDDDPYNGVFLCLKCNTNASQSTNNVDANTLSTLNAVPSPYDVVTPSTHTNTPKPILCKTCSKEGHYNSNSKKCSLFKGRKSKKKNKPITSAINNNPSMNETIHHENVTLPPTAPSAQSPTIVPNHSSSNTVTDEININTTNFIEVKTDKPAPPYCPVVDVALPNFNPTPTIFKIYKQDY